ncbi:MAG: outer membrane protein assembly factor BamB family protein, partial [Planctomycetota bacterium]
MSARATWFALLLAAVTVVPHRGVGAADWPQYRFDGSRSGYTPELIEAELSLSWIREARHPPHRAWVGRRFALSRMRFDWAPGAVVAGGMVYFGGSADHKVCALDAETGRERWTFFTQGPVRLAPAVSDDRLLVGSDDGHLYCLDRETGGLLWKLRAGPSDEVLVGNGRMISRWPVRGGVAVQGGVAYFGAGVWPEEDVYIYAVDVATGKVLWTNDSTGALETDQPHMVCFSRGGVISQGYLAVTAERVFVATGRSTPAVFDREGGDFLYYHLSRYGAKTPWGIGGGDVVAGDGFFYNSGLLFDSATGLRYSDRAINFKWWRAHITPDGRRA